MAVRVVRLGIPKDRAEGVRLGTVRLTPRGVKKQDYAKLNYFDVWLPEVSPSRGLVAYARAMPYETFAELRRDEPVYWQREPEGPGYFMQPTIVTNPALDSRVAREETFGPVLPIWRVGDLDEAIGLANDSEYGLGASVWTNDVRIIHRVANEVDAGMKWVNQFHYGYDELPFGGVKQSGYGKEHGMEGLAVHLGEQEGRRWYLIVAETGERPGGVEGRARDDLLFLAGECAGLLFFRGFAAEARDTE